VPCRFGSSGPWGAGGCREFDMSVNDLSSDPEAKNHRFSTFPQFEGPRGVSIELLLERLASGHVTHLSLSAVMMIYDLAISLTPPREDLPWPDRMHGSGTVRGIVP